MKTEEQLKNEKLACLILLQKYIEENQEDKAFILAMKIEELNSELEQRNRISKRR